VCASDNNNAQSSSNWLDTSTKGSKKALPAPVKDTIKSHEGESTAFKKRLATDMTFKEKSICMLAQLRKRNTPSKP
jgi:hypothetical protein